jgi:hypothetical protein
MDIPTTEKREMPLHLQLAMRKAEIAANEMTAIELRDTLLNLYHQRLLEMQAIKDLLQDENIELEFGIPTEIELAHLSMAFFSDEDEDDEDEFDGMVAPF